MLEFYYWLVVWDPLVLDPSEGVFAWSFRPSTLLAVAAPELFVCLLLVTAFLIQLGS